MKTTILIERLKQARHELKILEKPFNRYHKLEQYLNEKRSALHQRIRNKRREIDDIQKKLLDQLAKE